MYAKNKASQSTGNHHIRVIAYRVTHLQMKKSIDVLQMGLKGDDKMGKLSWHVQHYKSTQLVGIDRHNRRLTERHSNACIDTSKSANNIAIVPVKESLFKDTAKRIEQEVIAKGNRVMKNSIWISEVCCTLPQGIETEKAEEYFREIVNYFSATHGKENVISAYIHFDESTIHEHICLTNVTKEGKLSRREMWTRQRMLKIHDELTKHLQEKGFMVERGDHLETIEERQQSNLPLRQYKIAKEKEFLKKDYNQLVKEYNTLADKYNSAAKDFYRLQSGNVEIAKQIIEQTIGHSR